MDVSRLEELARMIARASKRKCFMRCVERILSLLQVRLSSSRYHYFSVLHFIAN